MALFRRLRNTFLRRNLRRDIEDELAWHLEQRIQTNMERGMDEEMARMEAKRRLGNATLTSEQTAETDSLPLLESWGRDLRFALRLLRKAPGFTTLTILALGLGIGATTMVFTVMRQVVLNYLPVREPERLVILHNRGEERGFTFNDGMDSFFSYPLYRDLREKTGGIFAGVLARFATRGVLTQRQSSELVRCELVSGNYFQVLEISPWRGRTIGPQDDLRPNGHPLLVLSHAYWQRAFGGDDHIVGQTVRMNDHPYVVIGVTPPGFYGLDLGTPPDVFVPMTMKAQLTPTWNGLFDRESHWCNLVARLKNGVSLEKAQTGLTVIYPALRRTDLALLRSPSPSFAKEFMKGYIQLTPGGRGYAEIRETLRDPLRYLALMVGVLLMITVVNVANLLLSRATARQREIAIRLSIGAGKAALIRQLLVESLALAALGGALGIALTYVATPVLLRFLSAKFSEVTVRASPDLHVLLFAATVSLGGGLLFGLLPALQAVRTDVSLALKTEGATGHTGGNLWLRRGLVIAQIAFSLVLLSAALLFSRTLRNIRGLDTGFPIAGLITFKVDGAGAGYPQARIQAFGEETRERLNGLRDVEAAGVATIPLLENTASGTNIWVEGYKPALHSDEEARTNSLSPGFFRAMKIPVLQGRAFEKSDLSSHPDVAVVNSTFGDHFFKGRNPIGGRLGFGSGKDKKAWTIIGVVADSQHTSLRSKIEPYVYLPYGTKDMLGELTFYVRARGDQASVMREIRSVVRHEDPNLPIFDLHTLEQTIDEGLFAQRGLGLLSLIFAAFAVLLAVIGLYGVMSYAATRRRREFGIRMAVGASPRRILSMMLREASAIGAVGVLCASPFVYATGKMIQSALYGVSANDPVILTLAAVLLLFASLLAGLIPARSAAHTDPQNVLRAE